MVSPSQEAKKNPSGEPRPSLGQRLRRFLTAHTDEWVLLGLAVFLFIVATNTQTGWLYVVVALLVGVLIVGFLGPRATLKGLEVRRRLPAPAALGDEVRIELEVRNPSKHDRLLVALEESLPGSLPGEPRTRKFLVERIPAGGVARVSYKIPATLRGYHTFPPATIRTGTPLGLFPAERTVEAGGGEMVVYPRGPRLGRSPVQSVNPRRSHRSQTYARAGASDDFMGIRPYHLGEDIRFVHWAATARTGEMMIREFRDTGGQNLAVLVENGEATNYGSGADSTLEAAVSAAASLAEFARRQSLPLTLMAERNGHVESRRGPVGDQAMDFLARIQAEGRLSWAEVIAEAARYVPADSHLYILAARPLLDPKALAPLVARRVKVTVVLFSAPSYHTNGRALLPDMTLEQYERSARELSGSGVDVRTHGRGEDLLATLQRGGRP